MQYQNTLGTNNTQQHFSQNHSFDVRLASLYGVHEAILINHFMFWISHNKRLDRNFREGRTWMYQSQEEIAAHYPYLNRKQVMLIVNKLVEFGVLIKGNFTKNKFDKTLWYAFKDEEKFIQSFREEPRSQELDYRKSEHENCIQGKDTKNKDTKKQQQQMAPIVKLVSTKSPAIVKPPASAAAFLDQEKTSRTHTTKHALSDDQSKRPSNPETIKFQLSKSLLALNIPASDVHWISKRYSEPDIEKAVSWATNPQTTLKKSLAQALKWFLGLPECDRPKSPMQKKEATEKNKKLAKQAEKVLTHPQGCSINALSNCVCIEKGVNNSNPIQIYYEIDDFENKFMELLKKLGFRRKTA